eukprot:CAMPEP_0195277906 /NCGR_PEP_ID=MMETSP0706-20130129/19475_1 /TAXON_ID=33640 /ORGANISM="Asterionellopsis glacialis, Strain CCMP134" /LENGTH=59 /DNA_ID=CAMNT_0040335959 /DNA_START=454 /DNA_END=633 /DNA_ORIENTATION=+
MTALELVRNTSKAFSLSTAQQCASTKSSISMALSALTLVFKIAASISSFKLTQPKRLAT